MTKNPKVLALSGGVGGAKLALGLSRLLSGPEFATVVNTGDDFSHFGLHISPDIDTLLYTLSGQANPETGWGRKGETWSFMEAMAELGGENWFNLGDKDLALHVQRTNLLAAGQSLTALTQSLARSLGISSTIIPMSDDPVRTFVKTKDGALAFQHYFVRDRCEPVVSGFSFEGVDVAKANPAFKQALESPDLQAIIICPSNPFVSVRPILDLQGVENNMTAATAPIVAVSPIIGGQAVKGPAAKMMKELGMPVSALGVAKVYQGFIDGFVIDEADAASASEIEALGMKVLATKSFMKTLEDRERLARETLEFAADIAAKAQT